MSDIDPRRTRHACSRPPACAPGTDAWTTAPTPRSPLRSRVPGRWVFRSGPRDGPRVPAHGALTVTNWSARHEKSVHHRPGGQDLQSGAADGVEMVRLR